MTRGHRDTGLRRRRTCGRSGKSTRWPPRASMKTWSTGFYVTFDRLRNEIEPAALQDQVYRYAAFDQKAVLEVGCGNGYLLSDTPHGARSGGLTSRARPLRSRDSALSWGRCEVLCPGDARAFRFATALSIWWFGRCAAPLPDIAAAIAEIHRVLKPAGLFVIMLYHRDSIHYRCSMRYTACSLRLSGKGPHRSRERSTVPETQSGERTPGRRSDASSAGSGRFASWWDHSGARASRPATRPSPAGRSGEAARLVPVCAGGQMMAAAAPRRTCADRRRL